MFKIGDICVVIPEEVKGHYVYGELAGKTVIILASDLDLSEPIYQISFEGVKFSQGIYGKRLRKATKLERVLK